MPNMTARRIVAAALLMGMAQAQPGAAQSATSPAVQIELSTAQTLNGACQLSFVVTNTHASTIDQAVYEMVLFDADGRVHQLTLLDFQDLPAGRPRVRQFAFEGTDCAALSRILVNGAQTCAGAPDGACLDGLRLTSRAGLELVG